MNSSREDYLQAIYRLSQQKGYTNNKSIAAYLDISKASVSEMMHKLIADDMVVVRGTQIRLSPAGREQAEKLLSSHRLWEYILSNILGMDKAEIHEQADLLEHATGDALRKALNEFLSYPTKSPKGKAIYENLEEKEKLADEADT